MSERSSQAIDQLRAHLEYYLEMGIDRVHSRVKAGAVQLAVTGKTRSKSTSKNFGKESENSRQTLLLTDSRPALNQDRSVEDVCHDLGDCTRCKLCHGRTHIVFGSGNPQAALAFVGEGPGADEDREGLPFIGRAGQLLTKMIEAIQLRRDQVYICNVVKCRPPQNRTPEEDEIVACLPFLLRQLAVVQPKVICCLGVTAAQTLLQVKTPISQLRATVHTFQGAQVIATYHPAYLLRNPSAKRKVWEDLKKIRSILSPDHLGN